LWAQNYEATDTGAVQRLHSLLQQYLKQGAAKIHDYQNIPAYQTGKHIIQTSLVNEVKQDLVKSLQLSIMLYHKKQLNRILELIDIDNQHQLFNAMEMLELELPKKIAKELNQLLDFITDPAGKINNNSKPAADSFFENIYLSSTFVYNPWTKAIVMYTAWKNSRQKEVQTIQQQHITQDHLIITETRNFVLDTTNQQTPCSL
jgi:ATP:ADP antiporter, AAA family